MYKEFWLPCTYFEEILKIFFQKQAGSIYPFSRDNDSIRADRCPIEVRSHIQGIRSVHIRQEWAIGSILSAIARVRDDGVL